MLAALLTACAVALPTGRPAGVAPQGNVLVVVLDDTGVDLIGAYESYYRAQGRAPGVPANTPAIDQLLAARGVMFTNAWTAPMCSPSRARLLTGRYGFRTGIGSVLKESDPGQFRNPGLQHDETLLPEVLRLGPVPYTSVAVGKWHLADIEQLQLDLRHALGSPPGRWFERHAGSMFNLVKPPGGGTQTVYSNWLKTYSSYLDPLVAPCTSGVPPCEVPRIAPPVTAYASADTTDDALAMVATLPEPWFLYVAYNGVHAPAHDIPAGLPQAQCAGYVPNPSPCDAGPNALFPARMRCMMEELDNQLGRLLCAVDEGDTTVILMGDNGTDPDGVLPPQIPSHGKGTLYEDGCRVPLIVRSPLQAAGSAGTVCSALVSSTDVLATAAEIAVVPATAITAEDSLSLVPYLQGQSASIRKLNYAEGFFPNFKPDPQTGAPPANYRATRHFQALRDRRFKLIRRTARDHTDPNLITVGEELYDLLQGGPPDPTSGAPTPDWFEQNDLLASGQPLPPRAARMLNVLRQRLDLQYPSVVQ